MFQRAPEQTAVADVVIAEPIWCDGSFGCSANLPRARKALILDTTLSGPTYDVTPHLDAGSRLVIAYSSGLKLDQAGLELANVGIVRIFRREGEASVVGSALKMIRGLTGTGLTFDELSALSAPWFMDLAYARRYTRAIFSHNRSLASSIGVQSPVFSAHCHPSLSADERDAPFCAIQLRGEPSIHQYRRFVETLEQQIAARGLVAMKGGSFGFRGHRFELIEPAHGHPFLRVALGWRDGYSREGLCDLFAELSDSRSSSHW